MIMRTHVEFRSRKFPAYPDEENEINPDLWGKRLAEYLQQRLRQRGFETEKIYAEDWGWAVPLRHETFSMWIGCGRYQEREDAYLIFIEPSKPMLRKGLFSIIDTTADVTKVADAIDAILTSDPEIQEVRWWAENERWNRRTKWMLVPR
jgi:hypothetical protein